MDSDQGNNKWCLDDNIMSRAIPEKIQQGGWVGVEDMEFPGVSKK